MTLTQLFIIYLYPALIGMLLGLFYYGTLWLILRKLQQFKYPAVWMSLSLLLRTLAVVFVMYLLFANSWQQMLIALLGILISRTLLVNRIKPRPEHAEQQPDKQPEQPL